ncbi:hypothetical protein KR018_010447, partial [Drosophila ironensis]
IMRINLMVFLCFAVIAHFENCVGRRRNKRLSSPSFDERRTPELAKYVVSIRSRTPRRVFGDNHFCAGVIISPRFVLTSAICTMDKRKIVHPSRSLLVVAGTENRLKYNPATTLNLPVKKIFVPVNFTIRNTNNIAILKLLFDIPKDNANVAVINLPTSPPQFGNNYTVLGWGRMYKGGPMSASIFHIDVELLKQEECMEIVNTFREEMLCAGNLANELDENPCAGDCGGPLLLNKTVYGIVSYRIGCGSNYLPSIYTDVYYHAAWIQKTLSVSG